MNELLAGPFDFIRVKDGTTVDFMGGSSTTHSFERFWVDDVGLCAMVVAPDFPGDTLLASPSGSGYYIAQLDGTIQKRSSFKSTAKMVLDLQRSNEYLYVSSTSVRYFDKRSGEVGEILLSGGANNTIDRDVRCIDRWLWFVGTAVKAAPLDNSTAYVTEATFTSTPNGYPICSPTEDPDVICICYTGGLVLHYNVVKKAQVGTDRWLGPHQGAWYSPRYGIFIALVYPHLKIFATTVAPATLSAVTAVDPVIEGHVSRVRARLLGDHSDPCSGELITWSLTAGDGALVKPQSVTDASGYAYNQYVAPLTVTTNPVIEAEVAF